MIKFKYLIHKETKCVLTYEEFIKCINTAKISGCFDNNTFTLDFRREKTFYNENHTDEYNIEKWSYGIKDILYSDDFIIIQEDFLTEIDMFEIIGDLECSRNVRNARNKLINRINELRKLESEYNVKI